MTVWSKKALPPLVEGRLDSPATLSTLATCCCGLRLYSLQGSGCGFGTQLCWSFLFLRQAWGKVGGGEGEMPRAGL